MKFIKNPRLSPDAITHIENNWNEEFDKKFGDYYIEGVKTGGAFYGCLEFYSEGKTHKQSVDVAVQLSVDAVVFSVGVDFSLSHELQERGEDWAIRVDSKAIGGTGVGFENSIESVENKARSFGQEVYQTGGRPYLAVLRKYYYLPQPPGMNYWERRLVEETLNTIDIWIRELDEIYNTVRYIERHPHQYINVGAFNLNDIKRDLIADRNRLFERASQCVDYPNNCPGLPDEYNRPELPERRTRPTGGRSNFRETLARAQGDAPGTPGTIQHTEGVSVRLRNELNIDQPGLVVAIRPRR